MGKEIINYEDIYNFPFEGVIFTPCFSNGEIIEAASSIHYKDDKFMSFPLDKDLDDIKVFKNYIMYYK